MALTATLELRETSGSVASAVYGALLKSYTVVDLDYTLRRMLDQTGRPSSIAIIDFLKVTVRGTKEITSKFHEWIQTPDKLMDGVIKIYDSSGYLTSMVEDVTGGDTIDYIDMGSDLVKNEIEDNMNSAMDDASHYRDGEGSDDIFDEMDRSQLLEYIASKDMDIQTDKNTNEETLRQRIRYYNKISKMSLEEMQKEANDKGITIPEGASEEDVLKLLIDYNNTQTTENPKRNPEKENINDFVDKAKEATAKTASSAANAVVKSVLEAARSITFKNAYCVSLREHFQGDPDNDGTLNTSYPWIMEIGIKPGTLEINGANVAGQSACDVVFDFFKV